MTDPLESELADLLASLSEVQGDLLTLLQEKRDMLVATDVAGLEGIAPREAEMVERLDACQQRRADLLQRAAVAGLPSDSIQSLAAGMPEAVAGEYREPIHDAKRQARLLQHHSLTNWVLVQRTLIHLSQLLEIFATGGRPQPTYSNGDRPAHNGSLVDQAV